ncbi:hypothetical protein [Pedobacter sp. SYSU D00535]|uniref:tetratricopeptide repeat protein n=1 Tax=Pedobacter sp. SYSU D00535 TaxID=2810308 RepID=UPI001A97946A|nr:hypothetical protein [Pedobacter sp. SYSU D00535]
MKPSLFFIAIFTSALSYAQTLDELWKKYGAGEYSYVLQHALKMESSQPNSLDLKLLIGRAYTANAEPSKALPYLHEVFEKDKGHRKAWAAGYLGSVYYLLSETARSRKYLSAAVDLNATETATRYAKNRATLFGYTEAFNQFRLVESEHIVFHFHPQYSGDIEAFVKEREQSFLKINSFFRSKMPKKVDFFVWDTKEHLKLTTGSPGGFARPEYCITHSDPDQTPGHELTHIISHYTNAIANKSILINEGTAVYFDQMPGSRLSKAKAVLKGKVADISIIRNWNARTLEEPVLYAVAGAFVEFLIEKEGKEKFLTFFKNQTLENARTVYNGKFDTLVAEFESRLEPIPLQLE